MRVYADSSFIVRLVTSEPESPAAVNEYRRLRRPRLFYLPLHALEVENAIYHRAFHARRAVPSRERAGVTRERDAALSRLSHLRTQAALLDVTLDMDAALDQAQGLSRSHSERLGARAIDLLHVSCALLLKSELFLSFDGRQLELARITGMQVAEISK